MALKKGYGTLIYACEAHTGKDTYLVATSLPLSAVIN